MCMADKGTDRQAFLQGTVDKYTWRDTGSSFILAEPLAALLTAQLERRDEIHAKRVALYDRYTTLLTPESKAGRFDLPGSRDGCDPVRHLFYVLVESETVRDLVAADMQAEGIVATFHYLPLHAAPAAARFTDSPAPCPVADDVSRRLLRLPFHTGIDVEGCRASRGSISCWRWSAMDNRRRTVLVTGGAGFIGGDLIDPPPVDAATTTLSASTS